MIEIRNVSKKYNEKIALANCNLQIPKGQVIGLFGANGAGKTTFMKCIMGFLTFEGEITLDGKKIDESNIFPVAVVATMSSGKSTLINGVDVDVDNIIISIMDDLFT